MHAPAQLERAGVAVQLAEAAQARGDTPTEVDHLAYLASQRITIAQESAAGRAAMAVTAGAGAERDRLLLAQRTQEVDAARLRAATAEQDGARKTAALGTALAVAAVGASEDKARLARSVAHAEDLAQQLTELKARKTERGIVVTLGDMLFDSGQARLRTGALAMVNLADFMKRNPQRTAVIEGFTDSVGSVSSNQDLSDRRAQAVMEALVGLGVGSTRLSARGFGDAQPVAANDTAAGRAMNRRVEVVFGAAEGDLLSK